MSLFFLLAVTVLIALGGLLYIVHVLAFYDEPTRSAPVVGGVNIDTLYKQTAYRSEVERLPVTKRSPGDPYFSPTPKPTVSQGLNTSKPPAKKTTSASKASSSRGGSSSRSSSSYSSRSDDSSSYTASSYDYGSSSSYDFGGGDYSSSASSCDSGSSGGCD